jgi:hypothetical protein
MKIKIFFLQKSCELGSKVQNLIKKSINIQVNRIELGSILVQF